MNYDRIRTLKSCVPFNEIFQYLKKILFRAGYSFATFVLTSGHFVMRWTSTDWCTNSRGKQIWSVMKKNSFTWRSKCRNQWSDNFLFPLIIIINLTFSVLDSCITYLDGSSQACCVCWVYCLFTLQNCLSKYSTDEKKNIQFKCRIL